MSEGDADSRKHRTTVTKVKLQMIQNLSKENFTKKDISIITRLSISTVNKNLVKIFNCSENDQPIESAIQQKGRKKVERNLIYDKIAEIVQSRKNYARTVRGVPDHYLLFLDKTGFNLHSTNNYGYSPVNIDTYSLLPANRQRNVNLMAIISTNGVLHHKCPVGSYNAESFVDFLDEFFTKYNNGEYNNHTIIMDNAKFYHSQIIKDYLNQRN